MAEESDSGDSRAKDKVAAYAARVAKAGQQVSHQSPVAGHVAETKAAAVGPANERQAGAKAAQVDDMAAAPAGSFDRAGFVAAVEAAIANKSPKTLEEADDLADSGALAAVKADVGERVAADVGGAAGPVEDASTAAPDQSRGQEKAVEPLAPPAPRRSPDSLDAAQAAPSRRPAAATDLGAEPAEVADQMKAEGVTEEQLADSGEPEFTAALDAKRAGDAHSTTAAQPVRAAERQILSSAREDARQAETSGLAAMAGARASTDQSVRASKGAGKSKDERARQQVANKIDEIHGRTQADTTQILSGLDAKVAAEFDAGEATARRLFESTHRRDMDAWRDKRYSGISGALRWAKDKIFDPPPEANRIFDRARQVYLVEMRKVVVRMADIVGGELTKAKQRIAAGRKEVSEYVASLPRDLAAVGDELGQSVQAKFDALDAEVDAKGVEMVDTVATRFTEATAQIDAKIDELKAANRGLWGAAKAKIAAVIDTIRRLKDAIVTAVAGAVDAIGTIIAKPQKFFGNLISAVGAGLRNFGENIGGHLQKGLIGWLTGSLGQAGITMPETFDLKGIIGLVLQILGLTWANIRSRIVKRLGPAGGAIMGRIESGIALVTAMVTEGPIALWNLIASKVSNLWDMVVGKLKEFLITKVITAGITWLIGLLNPVAGFIKACKAIVDIVQWFWNNASRLAGLLRAISSSIMAIASGSIGQAAQAVENALAQALPTVIGFLASLLGLGGLGEKVKGILTAVRRPINKVIDGVVGKAVKFGKRLLASSMGRKLTGGIRKGIAYGRRKIDQAKRWGQRKVQAVKQRVYGGDDSPEGKQRRVELALDAGVAAVNKHAGKTVRRVTLDPQLLAIRLRRGIGYLGVKPAGDYWAVEARVDRMAKQTDAKRDEGAETDAENDGEGPLGHARTAGSEGELLVGKVTPYSVGKTQDPRSKDYPELRLFKEHIIPRQFVNMILRAMGLTGTPTSGSWYRQSKVVHNYVGETKSRKDNFDHAEQARLQPEVDQLATTIRSGDDPDERSAAHDRLMELVDQQTVASEAMTEVIVTEGNQSTAGRRRGTGGDPRPTRSEIQAAAGDQRRSIKAEMTKQFFRLRNVEAPGVASADAVAMALQRTRSQVRAMESGGGYAEVAVKLKSKTVRVGIWLYDSYEWAIKTSEGQVIGSGSASTGNAETVAERISGRLDALKAEGH